MNFPKRRKPKPSGIARAPRREYPAHRKHVRGFECIIDNAMCDGSMQAAHVRIGTDGGTSLRPSDWFINPMCDGHHREQHAIGEPTFEEVYRSHIPKGLKSEALEFARRSPSYFKDEEFRAGVDKALEGK